MLSIGITLVNLLEECLLFSGREKGQRLSEKKLTLDLGTVTSLLLNSGNEEPLILQEARCCWECIFGKPLHCGKVYTDNDTIYR